MQFSIIHAHKFQFNSINKHAYGFEYVVFKKKCLYLRVQMAKDPDNSLPTFSAPSIFGCSIKSTHPGNLPGTKSWDLGVKIGPWGQICVIGPN